MTQEIQIISNDEILVQLVSGRNGYTDYTWLRTKKIIDFIINNKYKKFKNKTEKINFFVEAFRRTDAKLPTEEGASFIEDGLIHTTQSQIKKYNHDTNSIVCIDVDFSNLENTIINFKAFSTFSKEDFEKNVKEDNEREDGFFFLIIYNITKNREFENVFNIKNWEKFDNSINSIMDYSFIEKNNLIITPIH
ncbi:MAG: hypothetical protein ACRC4M_02685 [Mycoplasma sp.]